MSTIKSGKKPSSSRAKPSSINHDDIFMNPLGLDPELTRTIEAKGYSYRFINFNQFSNMGGSHPAHWRPISKKILKEWGYDTLSVNDFLAGNDTDGYIRRVDLILAVRPKDLNEKHKAYLRQEARRGQNIQARQAEELREFTRAAGLNEVVHEGYEDESTE